jgi:hypothetical protein
MKLRRDSIGWLGAFSQSLLGSLAALIWLPSATAGSAQSLLLHSRFQAKNAVIAVHLGWELEPVAVLRAERVFSDYQTRGFFRIGALPLLVMEKLRIELRDADRLSTVLAKVGESLVARGDARKAVEGRDFCLSFSSPKDGQLRARRIRLESGGGWTLLDGAVDRSETTPISFSRAVLTVSGSHAGELFCETASGTIQVHLLSLSTPTTNKPPL